VARYGTPQDVVWLASGTGIFDTGIKKIWAKKNPNLSVGVFILYENITSSC